MSGFVGEELEKIRRSHKELSSLFKKAERMKEKRMRRRRQGEWRI